MTSFIYINEDFKLACEKVVKGTKSFALPPKRHVRDFLLQLRHRYGMTRVDLAKITGISVKTQAQIESGKLSLSDEDCRALIEHIHLVFDRTMGRMDLLDS